MQEVQEVPPLPAGYKGGREVLRRISEAASLEQGAPFSAVHFVVNLKSSRTSLGLKQTFSVPVPSQILYGTEAGCGGGGGESYK